MLKLNIVTLSPFSQKNLPSASSLALVVGRFDPYACEAEIVKPLTCVLVSEVVSVVSLLVQAVNRVAIMKILKAL